MRKQSVKLTDRETKFSQSHRKEKFAGFDRGIKVVDNEFNVFIDCRIYWTSTFNTCTCCLWISGKNDYINASGSAGGYGYDKISAAIGDAIHNAGFDLVKSVDGVGIDAAKEALILIAKKVSKKRKVHLIECYG